MDKKILTRFFMLISLITLIGIGFTQNVYAASNWELTSDGWKYYENGNFKTGWVLKDRNWYYLDNLGIMKTGWIYDNGGWYYLCDTGAMDDSKTTIVMPNEIKEIYDIVKVYDNSKILKYSCIYHVSSKGVFGESGFAGQNLYKFYAEDQNRNQINEYYYDLSNGNVYKLNQGIITLLGAGNKTDNTNKSITSEEAIQKVKEYLTNNFKYIPNKIEYDRENGNSYVIHCYDLFESNTGTSGWYYVDKLTGNVTSMF